MLKTTSTQEKIECFVLQKIKCFVNVVILFLLFLTALKTTAVLAFGHY